MAEDDEDYRDGANGDAGHSPFGALALVYAAWSGMVQVAAFDDDDAEGRADAETAFDAVLECFAHLAASRMMLVDESGATDVPNAVMRVVTGELLDGVLDFLDVLSEADGVDSGWLGLFSERLDALESALDDFSDAD